ncbi:MAG: MurT ligase domain-containing protein [bacterium]
MRLKSRVGILGGYAASTMMRLLGRRSTALPGYVAERFDPEALQQIMRQRNYQTRIVVTGTNGKTTTTHILKTILETEGLKVVSNSSGSNLSRGILTSLIHDRRQGDGVVLLLEVDEASMPVVCKAVRPTQAIVLNLFRDQLDRYGEVTTTQSYISRALKNLPTQLILNADDPWTAMLGEMCDTDDVVYFGLDNKQWKALDHDWAADLPVSPKTGAGIIYSHRYFGHLGVYKASDGSYVRPKLDLAIKEISKSTHDQTEITYSMLKKQQKLITHLSGIYNAYNVAAALLTSVEINISQKVAVEGIEKARAAFGRQETISAYGIDYQFYLIKNPTGFNQVIQEVCLDVTDTRPIVFAINDNFADGRDVSWLWDSAIEDIQTTGICIASGVRAYDMALRLQYAGIACEVIPNISQAIARAAELSIDNRIRVLPTYTALLEIRKKLALKLEHQQ